MHGAIEGILDFWFGEVGAGRWFAKDEALDETIRSRYAPLWQEAAAGRHDAWLASPRGALALVLLLDQFPRNMFRDRAEAFSTDARARAVAKHAIDRRFDRRVSETERSFFYMPLMHSEGLPDQERCIRLIRIAMPSGETTLDHACKHRDVIRRFGRFPWRNPVLGRRDTDEERAYREAGEYSA